MTRETIAIGAVGATLLVALVGLGALLRADITELRDEVRTDVAELRIEVRADVAEIRADVADVRERLARLEGAVEVLTEFLVDRERRRDREGAS